MPTGNGIPRWDSEEAVSNQVLLRLLRKPATSYQRYVRLQGSAKCTLAGPPQFKDAMFTSWLSSTGLQWHSVARLGADPGISTP